MAQMKDYSMGTYIRILRERGLLTEYETYGREDERIRGLTFHSKEVKEGGAFICKGAAFKPAYLREAVKGGAVLYISEKSFKLEEKTPYILVKDIRRAMSVLANVFYNKPWEDLTLVGIGGTKGKSTSVYYLRAIIDDYMAALNKMPSAILSSIDIYDGVQTVKSHITTPEAVELQRYLRNAVTCGIEYAQMEVSSQALKYHRVDDMRFDAAIFLNISEDHISPVEHRDFEDYFCSKMRMFEKTDKAIVNLDAEYVERILKAAKKAREVTTFSLKNKEADFYAYNIRKEGEATHFSVKCEKFDEEFVLNMPGLFNVENALGVIAAAAGLSIPREYIYSGLLRARAAGRMEFYATGDKRIISIVDYAHNKLSFEKLYSSMKEEYPEYRIISIFGSAGGKAFNRRRDLGLVAGEYADKVYLVAEDPGYEPVADISAEIAKYVREKGCPCEMIEDRGEAIRAAIKSARGKTLLLIMGKGRETTQKYGGEYIACRSDAEYVKEYLEEYDRENGTP